MNRRTILLTATLVSGCHGIRNQTVYRTEISFTDIMIRQQAGAVRRLLDSCTCSGDGVWVTQGGGPECSNASDWWFTYTSRWAWHRDMMLYNGGSTSVDPGPAPRIPPRSCTLPTVTP